MVALSGAIAAGHVKACHDLSEGGLGVAAAEMAFAGHLGATIRLGDVPTGEPISRDDIILFSESNSRFLVEVPAERAADFVRLFDGLPCGSVGSVEPGKALRVIGLDGTVTLDCGIEELKTAWKRPLDW